MEKLANIHPGEVLQEEFLFQWRLLHTDYQRIWKFLKQEYHRFLKVKGV